VVTSAAVNVVATLGVFHDRNACILVFLRGPDVPMAFYLCRTK